MISLKELPDACPCCGPVQFFTWTRYESLGATGVSGGHNVACSRCGFVIETAELPVWGGLDITRHTDNSVKREEKSRKAGT